MTEKCWHVGTYPYLLGLSGDGFGSGTYSQGGVQLALGRSMPSLRVLCDASRTRRYIHSC
eukprot:2493705-Pyramimonas_sp.AAC.1